VWADRWAAGALPACRHPQDAELLRGIARWVVGPGHTTTPDLPIMRLAGGLGWSPQAVLAGVHRLIAGGVLRLMSSHAGRSMRVELLVRADLMVADVPACAEPAGWRRWDVLAQRWAQGPVWEVVRPGGALAGEHDWRVIARATGASRATIYRVLARMDALISDTIEGARQGVHQRRMATLEALRAARRAAQQIFARARDAVPVRRSTGVRVRSRAETDRLLGPVIAMIRARWAGASRSDSETEHVRCR
jgi:hypothetical protein